LAEPARQPNGKGQWPRVLTLGVGTPAQPSMLRVFLTRESLIRFALSFLLALALWLYVTGRENPNLAVDLAQPLQIGAADVRQDLVVTSQLPSAHVRYRTGTPSIQVSGANFRVYVDLLGLGPGIHRRVPVLCQSDPGITCASVTPRFITVAMDFLKQEQIPVTPVIVGQPPKGYIAQAPHIYPPTISVKGPRTLVSQVARASVDLNLAGDTSTLDGTFSPSLLSAQGLPVSGTTRLLISPSQVNVHVDIKSLSSFKPVPVLVRLDGQPHSGFGVTGVAISPPEVTVQGSTARLRQLTSVVTVPVSLSKRKTTFSAATALKLPKGVTASRRTVQVRISVQPVDSYTSVEVGITLTGVPLGLTAQANPARVLVTVIGPATGVHDVARNMAAVVNVSGFGAGKYSLSPALSVPPRFRVANVYPVKVSILLQTLPTG
jgi:YbbR domain-containing protein